jgi:hypothetical protein
VFLYVLADEDVHAHVLWIRAVGLPVYASLLCCQQANAMWAAVHNTALLIM